MKTRTRSNSRSVTTGRLVATDSYGRQTVSRSSVVFESKTIADTYEKKRSKEDNLLPDSPVDITTLWRRPPSYSTSPSSTFYMTDWPCDVKGRDPGTTGYPSRSASRLQAGGVYALQLLADTHPFRSQFSVPVMIKELLDISSMFKLAAKTFSEFAGGAYLNYRFGWLQFVNDVRTLASIMKVIEARIREIDSLSKHGGLKVRRKLATYSVYDREGYWDTMNSTYGNLMGAYRSNHVVVNVYGSCRWRFKKGLKMSLTDVEKFNAAVSQIFDLGTPDAETVWNIIPWTWLVDYFIHINDWLVANSHSDMLEATHVCITWRCTSTETWYTSGRSYKGISLKDGRFSKEIVSRDTPIPLPTLPPFTTSLLSWSQAKVILALFAKFRGFGKL